MYAKLVVAAAVINVRLIGQLPGTNGITPTIQNVVGAEIEQSLCSRCGTQNFQPTNIYREI